VVVCMYVRGDHTYTSLDTLLKRGGTKNKNVLGRGGFTHLRETGNIELNARDKTRSRPLSALSSDSDKAGVNSSNYYTHLSEKPPYFFLRGR
jgi:hypothetical protein